MTTIAWDGKTLAVDAQANRADMVRHAIKYRRIPPDHPVELVTGAGAVMAATGSLEYGLALFSWVLDDRMDPAKWPQFQADRNDWCRLIIVSKTRAMHYEMLPHAQDMLDQFGAFGSGRDFAMGAMAMGADATRAVETASRFDVHTGPIVHSIRVRD